MTVCPECHTIAHYSGHAHPDCAGDGWGCPDCGAGCDLDFMPYGYCAELELATPAPRVDVDP